MAPKLDRANDVGAVRRLAVAEQRSPFDLVALDIGATKLKVERCSKSGLGNPGVR